jgi:hypothetical protein
MKQLRQNRSIQREQEASQAQVLNDTRAELANKDPRSRMSGHKSAPSRSGRGGIPKDSAVFRGESGASYNSPPGRIHAHSTRPRPAASWRESLGKGILNLDRAISCEYVSIFHSLKPLERSKEQIRRRSRQKKKNMEIAHFTCTN